MAKQTLEELISSVSPKRELTPDEKEFNFWGDAYVEKFGGSLPRGIGMPDLTTELLKNAVETGVEIQEIELPEGAIS